VACCYWKISVVQSPPGRWISTPGGCARDTLVRRSMIYTKSMIFMRVTALFAFPDPVNEVSARLVAAGVVLMSALAIALDQPWLTAPIAYGFLARVLTGPTLSPLGQLVTRVIAPRLALEPRPVPGPPKRFAQGIGATMSVAAALLALVAGETTAAYALLGVLIAAAILESAFGVCLGCRIFALLMRVGFIPTEVCERCANIAVELPEGT
jgi:hypothetical protein